MILLTNVVTRMETKMTYLLLRNGWYYYDRRIPQRYAEYDSRRRVRVALNTQCKRTAIKQAVATNDNVEGYWNNLRQNNEQHSPSKFKQLKLIARQQGYTYRPIDEVVELPLIQLLQRVLTAKDHIDKEMIVNAVLGTEEQQKTIRLSQALKKFWDYSKPSLLNKNLDQQRKWRNPRKKAVKNFIKTVGDKNIADISNLDLIQFRDFWLKRMEKDGIKADTVNKDFTHLKGLIETVATHEELDLNVENVFKKIHIKETERNTRKAYTSEFIRDKIFNPDTLQSLDEEAQYILYVCANTGARPIEIVNLASEDIILDNPVPYIHIRPRQGYSLKTRESERKIPLAGKSLDAFKCYPNGFEKYKGNSEKISARINKWLSKNNLRPTKKHSLYSFRHSFQDRLTVFDVKDRVQCQLMGHSFKAKGRVTYGSGADLEHLLSIMNKISFF